MGHPGWIKSHGSPRLDQATWVTPAGSSHMGHPGWIKSHGSPRLDQSHGLPRLDQATWVTPAGSSHMGHPGWINHMGHPGWINHMVTPAGSSHMHWSPRLDQVTWVTPAGSITHWEKRTHFLGINLLESYGKMALPKFSKDFVIGRAIFTIKYAFFPVTWVIPAGSSHMGHPGWIKCSPRLDHIGHPDWIGSPQLDQVTCVTPASNLSLPPFVITVLPWG